MKTFRAVSGVYGLVDPLTGRSMYIGQSIDIDYRFRQHKASSKKCGLPGTSKVAHWIAELQRSGESPVLEMLAECGEGPEADEIEVRLIEERRQLGECELNVASGGVFNRAKSRLGSSHPDDWFQLGRKLKAARALLWEIAGDTGAVVGIAAGRRAMASVKALDRLRSWLDGLAHKQFPSRDDVHRMFYGEDRP